MHIPLIYLFIVAQRLTGQALAQIDLGTASSFGVVASTAIINTGATVVTGSLGLSPNDESSITGFPPGLSGTVYAGNGVAEQARQDARTAYNAASSLATDSQIAGADLGGQTLVSGTYTSASSVFLTGTLTLDGQNNPNSLFVFQIGSTLTTATSSSVVLINGAQACNVFFQIGSSATLGSSTIFNGNILALTSISLLDNVSVSGGLYALNGAVTLINDRVVPQQACVAITTGIIPVVSSSAVLEISTAIPSITQTTESIIASSTANVGDMTILSPSVRTTPPVQPPTSPLPNQPGSTDIPVISDATISSNVPQVPQTTSVPDVPATPVFSNSPSIPNIPDIPDMSASSDFPVSESFSVPRSMETISTSGLSVSTRLSSVTGVSIVSTKPLTLTRSTVRWTASTKPSMTERTSTTMRHTSTTSATSLSSATSSYVRSQSTRTFKSYRFGTSTSFTKIESKSYPLHTSTATPDSTSMAHPSSNTYYRQNNTTSDVMKTYSKLSETTLINGTPCTTLSYYEPTCACTQTTVVPISYKPGTTSGPIFKTVDLITVSGVPCTTTQYYEPGCDCVRASTVPIKVVASTASIYTVISEVPYVTTRYFESACNCVQTATVPVRIASVNEPVEPTAGAVCAETRDSLFTCIAACLETEVPKTTSA